MKKNKDTIEIPRRSIWQSIKRVLDFIPGVRDKTDFSAEAGELYSKPSSANWAREVSRAIGDEFDGPDFTPRAPQVAREEIAAAPPRPASASKLTPWSINLIPPSPARSFPSAPPRAASAAKLTPWSINLTPRVVAQDAPPRPLAESVPPAPYEPRIAPVIEEPVVLVAVLSDVPRERRITQEVTPLALAGLIKTSMTEAREPPPALEEELDIGDKSMIFMGDIPPPPRAVPPPLPPLARSFSPPSGRRIVTPVVNPSSALIAASFPFESYVPRERRVTLEGIPSLELMKESGAAPTESPPPAPAVKPIPLVVKKKPILLVLKKKPIPLVVRKERFVEVEDANIISSEDVPPAPRAVLPPPPPPARRFPDLYEKLQFSDLTPVEAAKPPPPPAKALNVGVGGVSVRENLQIPEAWAGRPVLHLASGRKGAPDMLIDLSGAGRETVARHLKNYITLWIGSRLPLADGLRDSVEMRFSSGGAPAATFLSPAGKVDSFAMDQSSRADSIFQLKTFLASENFIPPAPILRPRRDQQSRAPAPF